VTITREGSGQNPVLQVPNDNGSEDANAIGARLRRRRRAKRMTLRQVAEQAGLAEGFVSQLERGVHSGSVKTLQKICQVLGLTVGELFDDSWNEVPGVQRFVDARGFSFGINARKARVTPKSFDHLEVFIGVLEPYGSTGVEPYSHGDSEELLLVIEGDVEATVGEKTYRLGQLDSLPYSSKEAHRVAEVAGQQATVLWAISPPSY
jgi:transcriptional regulator with XRE-family HTH domain